LKLPLPILLRTHAVKTGKELAEGGSVSEMEAVGYLSDTQLRSAKQEQGFHKEHLVDVVDDGAASDLTDHAGEIWS